MNKMLVVVFENETKAGEGVRALRQLDVEGDISLYSLAVIARDAKGVVIVKEGPGIGVSGMGIGLAVGSVIGLLGGPVGLAVGAVTGTVAGALRDYWNAGVSLDFIEEAGKYLQSGKAAFVAEIEEEWVIPVDNRMVELGGTVFRRARAALAEEEANREVAALKAEGIELKAEYGHATGVAKASLHAKISMVEAKLDAAVNLAKRRVTEMEHESDAKVESLKKQLAKTHGEIKTRLEARLKHVRGAYDMRSAKLKSAWGDIKDALAV